MVNYENFKNSLLSSTSTSQEAGETDNSTSATPTSQKKEKPIESDVMTYEYVMGGVIVLGIIIYFLYKNAGAKYSPLRIVGGKTNKSIPIFYVAMILCVLFYLLYIVFELKHGNDNEKKTSFGFNGWDDNVDDNIKLYRTQQRGTAISMALIISALIQAFMKARGANSTILLTTYGFIFAAVMGFLGDIAIGTDEGYSLGQIAKEIKGLGSYSARLRYCISTLGTPRFFRYIVTVFLDMFISMPLQSLITGLTLPMVIRFFNKQEYANGKLKHNKLVGTFLKNYDNILQSFVGFITFLSYANQTRFQWAYPSSNIKPQNLINPITIKIGTAIAGVLYLVSNFSNDIINKENILEQINDNNPGAKEYIEKNVLSGIEQVEHGKSLVDGSITKLIYVIFIIVFMTGGSMDFVSVKSQEEDTEQFTSEQQTTSPQKTTEKYVTTKYGFMNINPSNYFIDGDNKIQEKEKELQYSKYKTLENTNYAMGITMFAIFLFLGIVLPFLTSEKGTTDSPANKSKPKKFVVLGIYGIILFVVITSSSIPFRNFNETIDKLKCKEKEIRAKYSGKYKKCTTAAPNQPTE